MAKEPALGTVKTRLAGALAPAELVELYEAFLRDKIDQIAAVPGVVPYLSYTPASAEPRMRDLAGERVRLVPQRGEDLGERLAGLCESLLERHDGVLLVDSDTPNLPSERLVEAVRAICDHDVVLGPAWDGGYYLIGLRRSNRALFEGIPWSTSGVLSRTVDEAHKQGLSIHLLASWYDVDEPDDLARLASDLTATPPATPGYPRRTAQAVVRLVSAEAGRPPRNEAWQTLGTRRVYQNPWARVDESIVRLPSGRLTLYGVVGCPDCVGVVPLLGDDRVLLVRQFRYVARRDTWEIPTGGVKAGERLLDAAQRELREECGYASGRLEHLSTFHTSKSIVDEVAHLYIGRDLEPYAARADETEQIEVRPFPFGQALDMVMRGEIVDSMSVIGLLLAKEHDWIRTIANAPDGSPDGRPWTGGVP